MAVRSYNIAEVKSDLYGRIPSNGEMELLLGENEVNDSLPSWWQYDSASMAPDNFANGVIQPTLQTGAGRWIRYNIAMTLPQAISDLAGKMNNPIGTTSQYLRGDGSPATFPSIPSAQVQSDWNAVSGVTAIANKPTLGTASGANTTDFATSVQGTTADNALQPTGNGSGLTGLTKSQVGLSNVDNTSDASKPVSTLQETAIALKENFSNKQNSLSVDGTGVKFVTVDAVVSGLAAKQATLVNTVNIKSVNGSTLLGPGNLVVGPVQYGTTYTKEWNGSTTTSTSTAVFNISGASFSTTDIFQVTCELSGGVATNSPFGVVTSSSATSVTVTLFESKTTAVLVGGNVEGLELHSVAGTKVYLTVKGN